MNKPLKLILACKRASTINLRKKPRLKPTIFTSKISRNKMIESKSKKMKKLSNMEKNRINSRWMSKIRKMDKLPIFTVEILT
jgi:hypothetical protein